MARRCCPVGAFWDAAIAAACVAGLAFGAWWLFGLMLRPLPGREARIILPGRGEGERLEQQVRSFVWLRGLGLVRCPVVIADIDLTPAGRELALRLALRWPWVVLWPMSDLPDYLSRT